MGKVNVQVHLETYKEFPDEKSMFSTYASEDGREIILSYFEGDGQWTNPGKPLMRLSDDGNGVDIEELAFSGIKLRLDYSQIGELQMLLERYQQKDGRKVLTFVEQDASS